ncbi:MAG: metallophosphoesterase [Saprospiraceae bacterium]|nr:metallophosphoesterase [Saprospiraceae bacterium]
MLLMAQSSTDTFLVKPYLQHATQNSIHILWETNTPATTLVRYGEAQLNAKEPNLSQSKVLPGLSLLHEVELKALQTATKYLYQVFSILEGGDTLSSPVYTFRTAVNDDDAYFFAFLGDSQYNSRTPWAWSVIAEQVWKERPHFIIHAGDLVDTGTRKTDWTKHFFPNGHVAMSRFPMYTVLGNHEQDAQYYYDYMVNPKPEYYYTFTYGNAQFFMIDTNREVHEGSEQYDWLEWELAKSEASWKFVVHHHPPYSTEENDHGDTYIGASTYQTKARDLTPLYDAYDVDFCLFGHTHVYERTWPLFNNKVNLKDGVIYINSGGAGGGLEDFDPTRSWFTQELQTGHHYTTFAVFDNRLVFKAVDHEGRLFDTFEMEKEMKNGSTDRSLLQPPAPHIKIEQFVFQESSKVELEGLSPEHDIYYTLDGSDPNQQSSRYEKPFEIKKSATIKARAYNQAQQASRVISRSLTQMAPKPALSTKSTARGLSYRYYEGTWNQLPDFSRLEPTKEGVVKQVNESLIDHRGSNFGLVLEGYVNITRTNTQTFYLRSDDGSKLYIDDELLIDHDGRHGAFWAYGTTILQEGKHKIRIEYFQATGTQMLRAGLVDDTLGKVPFTMMQLSH